MYQQLKNFDVVLFWSKVRLKNVVEQIMEDIFGIYTIFLVH